MINPPPHSRRYGRNDMVLGQRGGGGLPPTQPPYHHLWQHNFVPASPYAHLLGREAYPPQRGLLAWIGDRLNIPEVLILRGVHSRRWLYTLLRQYGVRVRRVGYQAAAGVPWWQMWRRDTYIHVDRYHGLAAKAILKDQQLEVVGE